MLGKAKQCTHHKEKVPLERLEFDGIKTLRLVTRAQLWASSNRKSGTGGFQDQEPDATRQCETKKSKEEALLEQVPALLEFNHRPRK